MSGKEILRWNETFWRSAMWSRLPVSNIKGGAPVAAPELSVDFCVVNGENAAVLGMLPAQAEELLSAGADVITWGTTPGAGVSSCPI